MCKIAAYIVNDVMLVFSLYLHDNYTNYHFLHFYVDIEFKSLYPSTSSTDPPRSFASSLIGSVIPPTGSITGSKFVLWILIIIIK